MCGRVYSGSFPFTAGPGRFTCLSADLRKKYGENRRENTRKKCAIMALFMYSLEKATANKRRQATGRRRRQTPHIERA